jgi:hypothetical protein
LKRHRLWVALSEDVHPFVISDDVDKMSFRDLLHVIREYERLEIKMYMVVSETTVVDLVATLDDVDVCRADPITTGIFRDNFAYELFLY